MVDYSPLVRLGRIVNASTSDRLSIGGFYNPDGDLVFEDTTTGPITLTALLAGFAEPPTSGMTDQGGGLSVFSPTQVTVLAGTAKLVEQTVGGKIEHETSWPTQQITSTMLAAAGSFWSVTDPGFTGTATIVESGTEPHDRVTFPLGISVHRGGAIIAVAPQTHVYGDMGHLQRDLLDTRPGLQVASGTFNEVAATLEMSNTDITLVGEGLNIGNLAEPHRAVAPASVGSTVFTTIAGDGSEFAGEIVTIPKTWNDGGVETALTGQKAAVHQVVIFPNGRTVVQLGKTNYDNFDRAVSSMFVETATNPLWPIAAFAGGKMAFAVVNAAATVWAADSAVLLPAEGGSAGGAAGASTYDTLGDTPTFKSGSDGKVVAVNGAQTDHVYADRVQTYVWYTKANHNSGVGVSALGTQHVDVPRWMPEKIDINVEASPAVSNLTVDIKQNGTSVVDGALPVISFPAGLTATASLLAAALVDGVALTVETIGTDTAWTDLTIEAKGAPRTV